VFDIVSVNPFVRLPGPDGALLDSHRRGASVGLILIVLPFARVTAHRLLLFL
jgi:hypothetical protein